jgi:hypothetical protein
MVTKLFNFKFLQVAIIGIVYLDQDYEVCKIGDILTPEQARILVAFSLITVFTFTL